LKDDDDKKAKIVTPVTASRELSEEAK